MIEILLGLLVAGVIALAWSIGRASKNDPFR